MMLDGVAEFALEAKVVTSGEVYATCGSHAACRSLQYNSQSQCCTLKIVINHVKCGKVLLNRQQKLTKYKISSKIYHICICMSLYVTRICL